ncbi:MAG: hypothetical protein WC662_01575 [Candidatus Paceibacterota bacterium]|jgi:hypothetical protein
MGKKISEKCTKRWPGCYIFDKVKQVLRKVPDENPPKEETVILVPPIEKSSK